MSAGSSMTCATSITSQPSAVEDLRGALRDFGDFVIGPGVAQRAAPRDAHAAHAAFACAEVIGDRPRNRERIALVVAADRLQEQRGIAHGSREWTDVGERRRGGHRMHGNASELRLDADEAGERRGNADRASAIRAERNRRHPRRDACRRATARSTRRLAWIPGVAGDAGQRRIADGLAAELARRRLADDAGPRAAQALDGRSVDLGNVVGEGARAERELHVLDGHEVLHRNGQPMQDAEAARRP